MHKSPKILLIFPPISDPMSPFLSLPSLTAFLRERGYEVTQKDLNIETLDALSSKENLEFLFKKACAIFKRLKKTGRQDPYYDLLAEILFFAPSAIANIEKAKRILRSKDKFYDPGLYPQSADVFHNALKLILRENYPFRNLMRVNSVADLFKKMHDREINPFLDFFEKNTAPAILKERFDLVGISVTFATQLLPAFTLAYLLKKARPDTHICMGGSIITYLSEKLTRQKKLFSLVDSFVINEGEHALLGLVEKLKFRAEIRGIPNLITLQDLKVSKRCHNFAEPIDKLPTPDFGGLPLSLYLSPELVLPIRTSRGCYWGKCAFCRITTMTGGKFFRSRHLDKVLNDIYTLSKKYKTRYFYFSDEAISPQAARGIALGILKKKLKLNWQCELRFEDDFNPKLCGLMFRAGCRIVSFGLESASERVLNFMCKGTNMKNIKKVLNNFKQSGIDTDVQFFTGFPTETRREAYQTLNFVLDNKNLIDTVSFGGPFQLFEGTRIFNNARKFGLDKIYAKKKNDLKLHYKYQVKSGVPYEKVRKLSELIRERLGAEYPIYFMYPAPNLNVHRLLYASGGRRKNEKQ